MTQRLCIKVGIILLLSNVALGDTGIAGPIRGSPGEIFLAQLPVHTVEQLRTHGVVLSNQSTQQKDNTGEFISALVLFEQDADTVLGLLAETARQVEYLPVLEKATTLEHYPNGDLAQHELKVLLINIVYRVKHQWDFATHTMQWHLDPTFNNDLRDVQGRWKLYPVDGNHTIGQYTAKVDVGRAVPQFIQRFLTKRDLPKALQSQRQWINSRGTFRKT